MKYPSFISSTLQEVEQIVKAWPIEVSVDHAINWLLQFDAGDYDLALLVVRHLNVVGPVDRRNALAVAYSKLERKAREKASPINNRNTIFAAIGDVGKSGAMMSYHFRMVNPVSEESFMTVEEAGDLLQKGHIKNVVLIDDIIGTGKQSIEDIVEVKSAVLNYGVANIFVLTVLGMREGLKKIENETGALAFSAFEYDTIDTIVSLDAPFYEGIPHDRRTAVKERIIHYGSMCSRSGGLGYGGIGALVVFDYNVPNVTLPIIWSAENGWIPLFQRVRRINGVRAFQKELEKRESEGQQRPKPRDSHATANVVSLFVEGTTDERFFTVLASAVDLPKLVGVKRIAVVALGSLFMSERAFDAIKNAFPNPVLIVEDDPRGRMVRSRQPQMMKDIPQILLSPSIMQFIDIDALYNDPEWRDRLPKREDGTLTRGSDMRQLNSRS